MDRFRALHEPLSPLRRTSIKPRRTSADVSTRVSDLRSRFEKSKNTERTRSSSTEATRSSMI
ncbi:hypothetical protein ANCCAN_24995 [Ancylostoma caninum]|nr:hypothetical protein ANCCAN_24995 [Ancylostoma caninum]